MLEQYMTIFYAITAAMATLIIPVIALYLVITMTADLLFRK